MGMKYTIKRLLFHYVFEDSTDWLILAWLYALVASITSMAQCIMIVNNETGKTTIVKNEN